MIPAVICAAFCFGVLAGVLFATWATRGERRRLRNARALLKAYDMATVFETPRPEPLAFIFGDMHRALTGAGSEKE